MDGQSRPTVLTKILRNIVCNSFRSHEDEDFGILLADLVKMLDKFGSFLEVAADFNNLRNAVIGGELLGSNVHLDEVLEEILL